MIPCIGGTQIVGFIETESRMEATRAGEGKGEWRIIV